MTESELCPPDPRIKYLIKKKSKVLLLYLKKQAIDVRGDRIPILSSF